MNKELKIALIGLTLGGVSQVLTGCAIREVSAWPPRVVFAEGVDFHIGTNAIDNVENKRGIQPYQSRRTRTKGAEEGAY